MRKYIDFILVTICDFIISAEGAKLNYSTNMKRHVDVSECLIEKYI